MESQRIANNQTRQKYEFNLLIEAYFKLQLMKKEELNLIKQRSCEPILKTSCELEH